MLLSIESSCDDSSIAITEIDSKKLIFHKKISQIEHTNYGGVVPELASRLHVETLPEILKEIKSYLSNIKAVAVTTNPGLSVTLLPGLMMAKAISISLNIPLISVNHLKGHIYSLFIEKEAIYPLSILLVSGGHTQIIEINNFNDIKIIASTLDDSFGESFDKVAKMLNLGYPGGPIVEKLAKDGDENRFNFPLPLKNKKNAFSYSGLKNAVRLEIEKNNLDKQTIQDICASFQKVAVEHLIDQIKKYSKNKNIKNFAIVGGASANLYLREKFKKFNFNLLLADLKYCSDNAAMIGRVAIEDYKNKNFSSLDIDISPKSLL